MMMRNHHENVLNKLIKYRRNRIDYDGKIFTFENLKKKQMKRSERLIRKRNFVDIKGVEIKITF